MFKIDRNKMSSITKIANAKSANGKSNSDAVNSYKSIIWNLIENIGEFSLYEMAHWNAFIDRWLHNRQTLNKSTYKRGEILFVDLGADNFRFEPSFTHPCIVLINRKTSLFVVPCSTKKFGQGHFDIIDAYSGKDGFSQNTGIQIEATRWVNKNRVISSVGFTSPRVLDEINKYMLKQIPTYKIKRAKFKAISEENTKLNQENNELKEEIQNLKNQINVLNKNNGA